MKSDDFADDWYGWMTNQCGHFCLGLGLSLMLGPLGLSVWWQLAVIIVGYWVVIEFVGQRLRLWRDAIMDTAFVAGGTTFMLAPVIAALICAALLSFGVWRRVSRAEPGGFTTPSTPPSTPTRKDL